MISSNYSDEVLEQIHFKNGTQKMQFDFYLLDNEENEIGELLVQNDWQINFNSLATINRTMSLNVLDKGQDFLNKRVKVTCAIADEIFNLGVFLIESPTKTTEVRSLSCYDKKVILQADAFTESELVETGELVTNKILQILNDSGIKRVNIAESDKVSSRDIEFLPPTTKLEAINTLLDSINYTSLYFDGNGYATAKPYELPTDKSIEFTYLTDEYSIIKKDTTNEIDLFDVPNVFLVISSNADGEALYSEYVNDVVSSPTSTVNRGRRIVATYEVTDIADQATLDDYARRMAVENSSKYEKIIFNTSIVPFHSYSNCIYIDNEKWIETSWTITADNMEHNARRVIYI